MKFFRIKKRSWLGLFGVVALLLAIAPFFAERKPAPDFDPLVGRAILPPGKIPPFALTDHRGQPFDNNSLKGHWTIAMIGFTYCPDVCPTTLLEIAEFYKGLEAGSSREQAPEFVFLTVDPFRDTPEVLGNYVAYFHKSFIGLTGEPSQIKDLVTELGLYYAYTDPEDDNFLDDVMHQPPMDGYGVVHSSRILFISPQGELVAIMTPPFKSDNISIFLKKLRSYYGD